MDFIKKELINIEASTSLQSAKTLLERNAIMLENAWLSDITFTFPKEQNMEIKAHKSIIATSSWYFFTLFGDNWGKTNQIEINDVSSYVFKKLLKYLYTDAIELKTNIAFDILHCAKYYGIPRLEEECNKYFEENLNVETVLFIFENIILDSEKQILLNEKCVSFLGKNITSVLETKHFLNVQLSTLERILKIKNLNCTECILFNAILKWATKACEDNGIPPSDLSKRQVLEHCVNLIRFPTMTSEEFAGCIEKYESFLTKEETHYIFLYIILKKMDVTNINFPTIHRNINTAYFSVLKRFQNPPVESSSNLYGVFNKISFFTGNSNVFIYGVGIYGRTKESAKNKSVETVSVTLKSENKLLTEVVHRLVYDGSSFVYPMLFEERISISAGTLYDITIERKITDDGYYWSDDATMKQSKEIIDTHSSHLSYPRMQQSMGIFDTPRQFSISVNEDVGDIPEIYYTNGKRYC